MYNYYRTKIVYEIYFVNLLGKLWRFFKVIAGVNEYKQMK